MYIKAFMGASLNGSISPAKNEAARFSSKECMQTIQRQLKDYDAVLIGAATLRAYSTSMSHPVQIVYGRAIPEFSTKGERVLCSDVSQLVSQGYTKIACLGGPTLLKHLIQAGLLNSMELTISSLLLASNTPLISDLSHTDITLVSAKMNKSNEVILNYDFNYTPNS